MSRILYRVCGTRVSARNRRFLRKVVCSFTASYFRNVKQLNLVRMLEEELMVEETPWSLPKKTGRGTFSAVFIFHMLDVIGCEKVELAE